MATIGYAQNGAKRKRTTRRKRRNPTTTTAKAKVRRNPMSASRVKAFAAKNGLKLVSKTAQNGRRRKRKTTRRRNGITAISRARNGILGNTKKDAINVGSVLAGAVGVKTLGRIIQSFVAPYMSQVGMGNYTEIIVDAALSLTVAPMVAAKFGGAESAKMARLGGLLTVAIDAIELVAPDALSWNPFANDLPVVVGSQGALLPAATVNALVQSTDASAGDKAKIAGALNALGSSSGVSNGMPMMNSVNATNSWMQ